MILVTSARSTEKMISRITSVVPLYLFIYSFMLFQFSVFFFGSCFEDVLTGNSNR